MKSSIRIIKKYKKNKEAIKWKQYLLDALMENLPDSIYFKDLSSRFVRISKSMSEKFNLESPEDAVGKTDYDFFKRDHSQDAYLDEQEIIRTGKPIINKEEFETWPDRPATWVSTTKMPLYDDNKKIIGTFGISHEITETKRILQEIENRLLLLTKPISEDDKVSFYDLFNLKQIQVMQDEFSNATGVASIITSPDGTPITNPSNFTIFCNDVVRKTEIGCANCYKSDSVLGSPNHNGPNVGLCLSGGLWDAGASIIVGNYHVANWMIGQVRDENQTEEKMREYARKIGVDENHLIEAFLKVPSMSKSRFDSIARLLYTFANQLSNSAYQNILQARFINEQKANHEELIKKEIQLSELLATKDKFFSIIAHDLKNPFNSILGFSNILSEKIKENDRSNFDKYVSIINDSSKHAINLLHNLLDWARSQTGNLVYTPSEIDVVKSIKNVHDLLLYSAIEKDIIINLSLPDECIVIADDSMLSTVLRNLVSNAIKYTNKGGEINISLKHTESELLFSVRDNGIGINNNDFKKVFKIEESFSTKGTENEKGTGIGLVLCKELVDKQGGEIWFESQEGLGSVFMFRIPV